MFVYSIFAPVTRPVVAINKSRDIGRTGVAVARGDYRENVIPRQLPLGGGGGGGGATLFPRLATNRRRRAPSAPSFRARSSLYTRYFKAPAERDARTRKSPVKFAIVGALRGNRTVSNESKRPVRPENGASYGDRKTDR